MLAPSHAAVAYIFTKLGITRWKLKENLWFTFGAIFPDLPSLLFGAWETLAYFFNNISDPGAFRIQGGSGVFNLISQSSNSKVVNTVYSELGAYTYISTLHDCFHSLLTWSLVILIAFLISKKCKFGKLMLKFSCSALLLHVITDWLTHTAHANRLFWPISERRPWGFLSHDNPVLLSFEISLWVITILILIYQLFKRVWSSNKITTLNIASTRSK